MSDKDFDAESAVRQKALVYYEATRNEVIQRLSLREQVLIAAIATFGVLAGVALRDNGDVNRSVLLIIPLVTGPFVAALTRHDHMIGKLGTYVRCELKSPLGLDVLQDWSTSHSLWDGHKRYLMIEHFAVSALLVGPGVCLLWWSRAPLNPAASIEWLYVFSLLSIAWAFYLTVMRLYKIYKLKGEALGRSVSK